MTPAEVRIWISNRTKAEKRLHKTVSSSKIFLSYKQSEILSDFFNKVTSSPDKNEFALLVERTSLTKKKLYQWFARQRFIKRKKQV
jgi:hypothetical protein